MAKHLRKENHERYTFHSFRWSSATAAADSGSTPQQMVDFFGWKNVQMTQEYISTSKSAVQSMASHLEPSSHEDKKKGPVMAGDVKEEAVMEEVVMKGDVNESFQFNSNSK